MRKWAWVSGVLVALTLWSCAGAPAPADAGDGNDAGHETSDAGDAGATPDAGAMDAGTDAGGVRDAGTPLGPTMELSPDPTLAFGTVGFIPSAPPLVSTRAFVITNTGPLPQPADIGVNLHLDLQPFTVTVSSGALDELCVGDFDEAQGTCSNAFPAAYDVTTGLEGGRSLLFLVHLIPHTAGHKAFELVLFTNDRAAPEKHLFITAEVVVAQSCDFTVTPPRVDFGVVTDGGLQTQTFTLHNAGSDVCYFDSFATSPTSDVGFWLPAPFASLQVDAGEDAVITTHFTGASPAALTPCSGAVRFSVPMTTSSSSQVPLEATLAPSCLSISPRELRFGDVALGCSAVTPLTVRNDCLTPVTWNGAVLTDAASGCVDDGGCPQFSLEMVPPASLVTPGQQRAFNVRFTPGAQTNTTGNVDVLLQASGPVASVHVALTGTGVAPSADGGCGAP